MIRAVLGLFSYKFPIAVVYMLQSTEYEIIPYLRWLFRTTDFTKVAHRRTLQLTKPAKLLLIAISAGIFAQIVAAIIFILSQWRGGIEVGIILILAYPITWALLVTLPLLLGRWLVIIPKQKKYVKASTTIFNNHKGTIIAVAGSYGKTTMKELLLTVLSEGKKVAATPANKNVAVSHAYFAKKLQGDEDVVIVEFGEAKPGDIEKFTKTVSPNIAVITGLAPTHLDKYKTIEAVASDMAYLVNTLPPKDVYINTDSELAKTMLPSKTMQYSAQGVGGWQVKNVKCWVDGLEFTATKDGKDYHFTSSLLGRHQVGPLIAVIAIADKLGMGTAQIIKAIAKTAPFEHRMQPYKLAGAWVIDDTYNGNIEGMRAGLELLKELPAKRKIYITPGLVDQGNNSAQIHQALGVLIANSAPDLAVLMLNSATQHIMHGLKSAGFNGEVKIEEDPLAFYTNLDQFVAAGDIILMQNDWTDNYA